MPNDSSTGGYLLPAATPAPIEDDALDDFLGDVVGAITGLDRDNYVRPRWQLDPPNLPARNVNWVGVGVINRKADTYAVERWDPDAANGAGAQTLVRHESLEVLCSFYGAACQKNGANLRDGLAVAQNREALFLAGMALTETSDLTKAPEMIKSAWYQRADLTVYFRREIRREYPVLTLLSARGTIITDVGLTRSINADPEQQLDFTEPGNSGLIPVV
jgi:hypothetical protein